MAPDNHVNFRVRGIPLGCQSRSEVRELIESVLHVETGTNLVIHSLAINPAGSNSRVATLTFNNIPPPLCDKTNSQWIFDLPGAEACVRLGALVFDTHFSGFTPLQHTDQQDCRVDVVALSGLGGHAFGSFKERNGRFMWLRDALALDMPIARILIYGYDTTLYGSASFQNLADLGRALQADLKIIRKSGQGHPLIFVGHSLGGLVIKEAIAKMREDGSDKDCEILQSTSAFLFFGVPHEGMAIETLLPLVGDQPNRALLETLGKNSEVLHRLQRDFSSAFGTVNPKVVSYFETEKSPTAQKKGDEWELTGPLQVLVDPASAVCGSKEQHPINRSHSNLVKYASHYEEIYARVRATLDQLVSSTKTFAHDCIEGEAFAFLSDQQKECLRSFRFAEQDQRFKELRFERGTCEWLRDNRTYRTWMSRQQGLLWIKGNPGAGKSCLMKSAYTNMSHWNSGELIVSFFFHGRGVPLQKTSVGLLRALLASMLASFPDFLSRIVLSFQEREKGFGSHREGRWTWFESELQDFLSQLLTRKTRTRPVVIFIDALDECGRDTAKQLISYFKDLMTEVVEVGGKVKVCFSSRHYPVLGLDVVPTILVEEHNGKDIRSVIQKQLKEVHPEAQRRQLEKEILMKAQGGFQWSVLVTSRVTDGHAIGINAETLRNQIRATPQALEQLYADILSGIPDSEKGQTTRLFEWVLFAGRPLIAQELRDAMAADKDMTCTTVSELRRHPDWTGTVQGFERRVKHLSRGLVEFQTREIWEQYEPDGEDFNREAQFIHQSVPEFLQKARIGGVEVCSIAIPFLAGPCHFELAMSCIKYLMLSELLASTGESRESLSARFPLAPYAVHFFFHHIREAETRVLSHHDVLSLIHWGPQSRTTGRLAKLWKILNPHYTHTPNGWPFLGATALHVIITIGSMSAFESALQEESIELNGRDSEGNSPLILSMSQGHHDMALLLIDRYAQRRRDSNWAWTRRENATPKDNRIVDVDAENDDGDTALSIAVTENAKDVVRALVKAGADLKGCADATEWIFRAIRARKRDILEHLAKHNAPLHGTISFVLRELRKESLETLKEYLLMLFKAGATLEQLEPTSTLTLFTMCLHNRRFPTELKEIGVQLPRSLYLALDELSGEAPEVIGEYFLILLKAKFSAIKAPLLEAIHLATRKSHEAVVTLLLSCKVFPRALILAAIALCRLLVRQAPTGISGSLLKLAMEKDYDFVRFCGGTSLSLDSFLRHLLRDIDAEENVRAISILAQAHYSTVAKVLSQNLARGKMRGLFMSAVELGFENLVEVIVRHDRTCISQVCEGKSLLIRALEKGMEKLALFLVNEEQSSNVGIDTDRRQPLLLATMKGYTAVVKAMIQDEKHYHKDEDISAAFSYATVTGHDDIASVFNQQYPRLKKWCGWDAELRQMGKSHEPSPYYNKGRGAALTYAIFEEDSEITRLLLRHVAADHLKEVVDKDSRDVLWHAVHASNRNAEDIWNSARQLKLTDSITISEAMILGCDTSVLKLFLREPAAADFPSRHPISIPREMAYFHTRRSQWQIVHEQVVTHAADIAPIVIATVYNQEQAVAILLATGQVSDLFNLVNALRIAETFGFGRISARLKRHSRAGNLPSLQELHTIA